ncbi:MAG: hypothetical protein WHF31_14635 [Candidatus Dehalobacter alkaniphilus]|nr:hypothetical protein [Dehalobacter sp.]
MKKKGAVAKRTYRSWATAYFYCGKYRLIFKNKRLHKTRDWAMQCTSSDKRSTDCAAQQFAPWRAQLPKAVVHCVALPSLVSLSFNIKKGGVANYFSSFAAPPCFLLRNINFDALSDIL